jgi:acetylornithine deacetylase/succinyl-diaminopimelate desuccinylase-like protein
MERKMQISKRNWRAQALAASACLACAACVPLAFSSPAPDFAAVAKEATGLLVDYVSIDTTNPPGNEAKGAEFLAAVLRKNGIETQLYETAPGRSYSLRPPERQWQKTTDNLAHHIDVVPAKPEDWQHHPLSREK